MEGDEPQEHQLDNFKPRPYQDQILEICLKKNTIIYLPTGAGKTFIALMAMKYLAKNMDLPLSEGGKRSVFVVNTVALALQQKEFIERATSFKTAVYTGDMSVDMWSNDRWLQEFENNQVLVATCQIILDIIRHGYVQMKHFNVIVFDEAHHANKDNPMKQLMSQYAEANEFERPRVIGLTGMLLNGSVRPNSVTSNLEKLENTLHGTIATVKSFSDHANVLLYSTNPEESVCRYDILEPSDFQIRINSITSDVLTKVQNWPHSDSSQCKKVIKLLNDFLFQTSDLGNYGSSIAIISVLVELELIKLSSELKSTKQIVRQSVAYVEHIRGLLVDEMDEIECLGDILSNSSEKIAKLILLLKRSMNEIESTALKALIFVKRRHTAKNVFLILKKCSEVDETFLIRPDFMVGNCSSMPDSIEQILANKWNRQVIDRFKKNQINVIIATSVLEEGIDLQMCNLVVSYDEPQDFRSYIQSKGRARKHDSKYVIMCPDIQLNTLKVKLREWNEVDNQIKNFLIGKSIDRPEPNEEDIQNEFAEKLIPSFRTPKGAVLESKSAIQLLNRYCQTMPNDMFTNSQVICESKTTTEGVVVSVTLPIQSVVKEIIHGDPMPNLKMAKRSAAFKACKLLYEAGELNENLMPMTVERKSASISDIYFKHFMNFPKDNKTAGTKKNKRTHAITYPERLMHCMPVCEEPCYLHTFIVTPKFKPQQDDFSGNQFLKLLQSKNGFGILTRKMLPNLASMNFYITLGQIGVTISSPTEILLKDSHSLSRLRSFHATLFSDVLQINQPFLVYDNTNKENSFYIVPVTGEQINWKYVDQFQAITEYKPLSEEERGEMEFKEDDYMFKVISPFYRVDQKQRYIVTKIHTDKSPLTEFPNDIHTSYAQYFLEKYFKNIIHKEQFLIEVKGVTQSLNFLSSGDAEFGSKKAFNKGPELLVPELCHNYRFDGDLCLKSLLIPSILHRLHYLLHAEAIRTDILKYLNIPEQIYHPKPVITKMARRKVYDSVTEDGLSAKSIIIPDPNQTPVRVVSNNEILTLNDSLRYPWPEIYEPVNLNRQPNDLYPIEISYYHNFINSKLSEIRSKKLQTRYLLDNLANFSTAFAICDTKVEEKSNIKLLNITADSPTVGPEQCDILAALTSSSVGDQFDMERLELMGDSLLKFAVSFYLLQKHPTWHEGFLTACKGKIVSNRNLCYLAIAAGFPGMMNINKFNPRSDWAPPLFHLPEDVKFYTKEAGISPNIIHKLNLSQEEIKSGILSTQTLQEYVAEFLNEPESSSIESTMSQFFGEQQISDKTAADCVESILGACVVSLGIERSLPILKKIGILPDDNGRNFEMMLLEPFAPPCLRSNIEMGKIDDLLLNCDKIEEALGYNFKNRAYLLQALTHPSFQNNQYTSCYQQFEFLGDAILDFLISSYIYEQCVEKNPGQLTDLRSALVNNITLACICVRNKFHLHILSQSSVLLEKINVFYQYQEEQKHAVTEQVLLLIGEDDGGDDGPIGDFIDVPKVLGDVVEAIFGAVFLDSSNSLKQTWNVIYKLMKKEINSFMHKVPIQVARQLYEFPGANPKFENPIVNGETVMVAVRFTCKNEVLRVQGFGPNSAGAKRAAAKVALHKLTM